MKKIHAYVFTFIMVFFATGAFATTHNVNVTDNAFQPDSFSANVGDTITWTAAGGNLWKVNSFSLTIPGGAAAWSSGGLEPGNSFSYVVTTPGDYHYESDSFYVLTAVFTVLPLSPPATVLFDTITDNGFEPDSFTANVGDTVRWVAAAGNLWKVNSFSLSIPNDAAPWTSGGLEPGDMFSYVITAPGSYHFESDSFYTLHGTFTVAGGVSGINPVPEPVSKLVFQNPFGDNLVITSGQPGQLTIFDLLGNKLSTTQINFANHPVQINMAGLNAGIYLIAFSVNGNLVQTYKAVKGD